MHAYVYLLHVLLLNKKKLIDIGKITAHLYFNVTKNTVRIHFVFETPNVLGFSSFDAKRKTSFTWPDLNHLSSS